MKFLWSIALLILLTVKVFAQPYGNEWINYSQKYWKIPITEDGIYQLSYTDLSNMGFPVNSVSPKNYQLFGRGVEQAIYIEGEADGIFNTGEFIQFVGRKNDGYFDTQVYEQSDYQLNPHYSLINDTAWYFLTYNNLFSGNKRIVNSTDVNFGSYTPLDFATATIRKQFVDTYYEGPRIYVGEGEPGYMNGEGYASAAFGAGSGMSVTFNAPDKYNSGTEPSFKFVAISDATGENKITTTFNSTPLYENVYYSFNKFNYEGAVSYATLNSSNTFSINSVSTGTSSTGRLALAYGELKYTRGFDFSDTSYYEFDIPNTSALSKVRIDLTIKNGADAQVTLIDTENSNRYVLRTNGAKLSALLPPSSNGHHIVVCVNSIIKTPTTGVLVNNYSANPGYFKDYAALLSNTNFLIISHPSLFSEVSKYSDYRTSKGYNSSYIDVNELYDQFANGIIKHPMAIKNLVHYINDTHHKLKYLLLLGKSIQANLGRSAANYSKNLVPTWGVPGSDNMLTSGLLQYSWEPMLATGRLAAQTTDHVKSYLDKLKEFESAPKAKWMKNILHFAGGSDASQNAQLKNYLQTFQDTLEGPYFGGKVHLFSKTTDEPIQTNVPEAVRKLINEGSSILNFFGHAAGAGFEFSIDQAVNYNNIGRYPLIVANSCFAGDIHSPSNYTVSEDWIFTPDKGAIAFVAQVGLGIPDYLHTYSGLFYHYFSRNMYAKPISLMMKQTIHDIDSMRNDLYSRTTSLEMTLHGDPAIVLNCDTLPDYLIEQSDISFNPNEVNSSMNTFELEYKITNIGKAVEDSVKINIERTLPTQQKETLNLVSGPIYYEKNLISTIETHTETATGLNSFCVSINENEEIKERLYTNNKACNNLLISSLEVFPVYPYEFAIIDEIRPVFKASVGSLYLATDSYKFEIDTTETFNSAFKVSKTVTTSGTIISLPIDFDLKDSLVYYWRVARDTIDAAMKWRSSSFHYIPQKRGWGQAHFYQFKKGNYKNVSLNETLRKNEFVKSSVSLETRVIGNSVTLETGYLLDNFQISFGGCGFNPSIQVAVFDSSSITPWSNDRDNYGHANYLPIGGNSCSGNKAVKFLTFQITAGDANGQQEALRQMIDTAVPNGYYVLMYTYINGSFANWTPSIMTDINSKYGLTLNSSIGNTPYIGFFQKGDKSTVKQVFSSNTTEAISLFIDLDKYWDEGTQTTTIIGPGKNWNHVSWDLFPNELNDKDTVVIKIDGYTSTAGTPTELALLRTNLREFDLSQIANINNYPYLKMELQTKDLFNRTPTTLKHWRIFYEEAPEAALDVSKGFSFANNVVQEGDSVRFSIGVSNISIKDMDSLLVNYWLTDASNTKITLPYAYQKPLNVFRQQPLLKEQSFVSSITFPTSQLSGANVLWIEINPNEDQPEQYHFNNIAYLNFKVEGDGVNPLLDVTFDGIRIMDGDIVSAKPEIIMGLKDESKFLALKDTSSFTVSLVEPNQATPKQIFFYQNGIEQLKFIPASLPENRAKVIYNAAFPLDGKYKLIVNAKDASNNKAGKIDYAINFEVINKSTITEVLNYPNPFTTSTRFVFTLTGSTIPETFKIQIVNISGKVVREIEQNELGLIHIGRNITEFSWDGTDQYGDRLANGVYFYRVITRINSEEIEKRTTEADAYFKKGFGKMYLMR